MNSDEQRRKNAQDAGSNAQLIPDTHLPERPITPVPESAAARDAIEKTLPDLTGEARQYAQQQLKGNR